MATPIPENLIQVNPGAEQGNTDGWSARTNSTLTSSTDTYAEGSRSFKIVPTAAGALGSHGMYMTTYNGGIPNIEYVLPGKQYTFSAQVKMATGKPNRTLRLIVNWYAWDDTLIKQNYLDQAATQWTWNTITTTLTSPPLTDHFTLMMISQDATFAVNDTWYVDDWKVVSATVIPTVTSEQVVYDPRLLKVYKYTSAGKTDTRTEIPVSSLSIAKSYSLGEVGELSVDPSSATVSMSWEEAYPPVFPPYVNPAGKLFDRDRVVIFYASQMIFAGYVVDGGCQFTYAPVLGKKSKLTVTGEYSLNGLEADLEAQSVGYSPRPEESALARLERYFTVDYSKVQNSQYFSKAYDYVPADAGIAGVTTRLAEARKFSAFTGLPIRFVPIRVTSSPVVMTAEILEPRWEVRDNGYPPIDDALHWASNMEIWGQSRFSYIVQSAAVRSDDTRLTGTGAPPAGTTVATLPFKLPSKLPDVFIAGGFRVPLPVKVNNESYLARSVTFEASGEHMTSAMELGAFPEYEEIWAGSQTQPL